MAMASQFNLDDYLQSIKTQSPVFDASTADRAATGQRTWPVGHPHPQHQHQHQHQDHLAHGQIESQSQRYAVGLSSGSIGMGGNTIGNGNGNSSDSEMNEIDTNHPQSTPSQPQPQSQSQSQPQPDQSSQSDSSIHSPPLTYLLSRLIQLSTSYLYPTSNLSSSSPSSFNPSTPVSRDLISATFYSFLALHLFPTCIEARRLYATCVLNGGEIFPFYPISTTTATTSSSSSSSSAAALIDSRNHGNRISSAQRAIHIIESGQRDTFKDKGIAMIYSQACEVLGRFNDSRRAFEFASSSCTNPSSDSLPFKDGLKPLVGPIHPIPPTPTVSLEKRYQGIDLINLANLLSSGNQVQESRSTFKQVREIDAWSWSAWLGENDPNFDPNKAFPSSLASHSPEEFLQAKFKTDFKSQIPDLDFQKEDVQISELISQVESMNKDNNAKSNSMPPPNNSRARTTTGDQTSFPRPGSRVTTTSTNNPSSATSVGTKRTRSIASSSAASNKNDRSNSSTASAFGISASKNKNSLSSSTSSNVNVNGPALSSARINVGNHDARMGDDRPSSQASNDSNSRNKDLKEKDLVPEVKQKVLPQRVTRATTGPGTPVNSTSRKTATTNVSSGLRRLGGNTSTSSNPNTSGLSSVGKGRSLSSTSEKRSGVGKISSSSSAAATTNSNKKNSVSSSATTSTVSRKGTSNSNSSSETDGGNTIPTSTNTKTSSQSHLNRKNNSSNSTSSSSSQNVTSRENQTSSSSILAKLQKDKQDKIAELKSRREMEFLHWENEKKLAQRISIQESEKWKRIDLEILKLIRSLAGGYHSTRHFKGEKALKFLRLRNQHLFEEEELHEKKEAKAVDKGKGKEKEKENFEPKQSINDLRHENELYKAYVHHLTGSKEDEITLTKMNKRKEMEVFGEGIPRMIKNSSSVRRLLGKIYHDLSKYHLSEKEFSLSRRLDPFDVNLMDFYSTVLYHLNRETLLSSLSQELNLSNPSSLQSQISIGNAFSLQSNHELALKSFRRSILLDGNQSYAYTLAGYESLELGLIEESMSLFRFAIRNDRNHWNAYAGLGKCFLRAEKWEYARECYEIAIGINGNNAALWELLGTTLEKLRQLQLAMTTYTKSIVLNPTSSTARLKRAELSILQGLHEFAHSDLLQCSFLSPDEVRVHLLLAHSYMRKAGGRFAPLRGGMNTATGKTLTSSGAATGAGASGSGAGGGWEENQGSDAVNGVGVGGSISNNEVSQRNSHKAIGEPKFPPTTTSSSSSASSCKIERESRKKRGNYFKEISLHLACAIELDPKSSRIIRSMGEGAKAALRGVNSKSNGPGEVNRRDKSNDSSLIRDLNGLDGDGMEEMYQDVTEDEEEEEGEEDEEEPEENEENSDNSATEEADEIENDVQEIIESDEDEDDDDDDDESEEEIIHSDDDQLEQGSDQDQDQDQEDEMDQSLNRPPSSDVHESSMDQSASMNLQDSSNESHQAEISTGVNVSDSSQDVDMSLS